MSDHVSIRKDGAVGTVMIDRADRQNALTPKGIQDLQTAFSDLHGERNVRGVILTGAGSSFCVGTDLVHLHEQMQCPDPESFWQEEMPDCLALFESMLRFPKPIIAAVDGRALGVGLALMLCSDYIVASDSSNFGTPEVRHGLMAGLAAPLIRRRCTPGVTNRLIYSGAEVDAAAALAAGLVDEIQPADRVWARAHQMVSEFVASAPTSLQLSKQLINETIDENLFTQLSIGTANMAAARSTDAARKGVEAFVNKTKVTWD